MDIKIVNQQGEEEKPQVVETPDIEATSQKEGDIFLWDISQMFNMTPNEFNQNKTKLNVLLDYAKAKTEDHSAAGIKWALRETGMKMGTPPLGEKLINYLYNYARLYLDGKRIEEQKQKYLMGE